MQSQAMDEKTAAVWQFLHEHYFGHDAASPRTRILEHFHRVSRFRLDDREFRNIVADLVTTWRKPICSTATTGYYVALDRWEIDAAVADLRKKARSLQDCATALDRAIPVNPSAVQQEMF